MEEMESAVTEKRKVEWWDESTIMALLRVVKQGSKSTISHEMDGQKFQTFDWDLDRRNGANTYGEVKKQRMQIFQKLMALFCITGASDCNTSNKTNCFPMG